ncbi:MAG: hypothetical protein CMA84_05230 [Euryarchaeota archaeon]|nr:hypothetical protein [Euryarchaeota archaeon]
MLTLGRCPYFLWQIGHRMAASPQLKACSIVAVFLLSLTGSLQAPTPGEESRFLYDEQVLENGWILKIPDQQYTENEVLPWWMRTSLDLDRNGIHDSLQTATGDVYVGLSFEEKVTQEDVEMLESQGYSIRLIVPSVNAILIGKVLVDDIWNLAELEGVVMVERYGEVVFYGDVQTPAVKARASVEYPESAWMLNVSGKGVNIALTDTGVDEEHPGLQGKFVAGYDAVCYLHSDPSCSAGGFRETDGTFNPDDAHQHGTACMGMAAATGFEADGSQSEYYGSAPDAKTIDVRIGTDVGAGPFENYLISQDIYESAMNGLQWILDNKDTEWQGAEEADYGIDIISLSWGITSHETGGSDGEDMHSRLLNEAMESGITVSVAAGNDGPNNDGLSGMGSSSLSITVGATDDNNTVDRSDDTIASYSSRGERRDNGDNNPINELKPEITAPGSNIIQAEGCVSDPQNPCNNFLGGDASDNTYTSRGSGTSYATPSVSGIIALIIEANPDLSPLAIKEVLKQTAERRGEPSAPDIDPYWNRDFGYGMVDARAAVELAIHLGNTNQSTSLNPSIQHHLLDTSKSGNIFTINGHAWSQIGVVDRVEFRVNGGPWSEVTYQPTLSEIETLTPFNWSVSLDTTAMPIGENMVEVRAADADGNSLPIVVMVEGQGLALQSSGSFLKYAFPGFLFVFLLALSIYFSIRGSEEEIVNDSEPLLAEIVTEEINYELYKVTELKDICRERDLSVSGTKAQLIERIHASLSEEGR